MAPPAKCFKKSATPYVKLPKHFGSAPGEREERLNVVLARLDLEHSPTKTTKTFGNRAIKGSTVQQYKHKLNIVLVFIQMYGFDEDLIILDDRAPEKHCPAMSIDTVCGVMQWKTLKKGETVMTALQKAIDPQRCKGQRDKSHGGWNDPKLSQSFHAAVKALHIHHGNQSAYSEACPECVKLWSEKQTHGCKYHPTRCTTRQGNPADHPDCTMYIANLLKYTEHTAEGAGFLMPLELRTVGEYCINKNDIAWNQFYVIVLVSIDIFLRKEEFSSIECVSFPHAAFLRRLHSM
jgi:hypothetical protein